MLETVLGTEGYLFTEDEIDIIQTYRSLPCEPDLNSFTRPLNEAAIDPAQFLLIRLILRKSGKWHRSDHLNKAYRRDISDLKSAIESLCRPLMSGQVNPETKIPEDSKYIVILDSDDEGEQLLDISYYFL